MIGRARTWVLVLLAAALPAGAGDKNPPPWEKPLLVGRYLYRENCSACHEINKPKKYKFGPSLFRLFQNEKLPLTGGKPTEEYVVAKVKNGGVIMPPFRRYLTDEQIGNLIAYIRSKH